MERLLRLESVSGQSVSQPVSSGKITKFKAFNFERRTFSKYTMPECHFDGFNLWLLKPTHLNRGRGIHVFRDLETLMKLIKQYCVGKEETKRKDKNTAPAAEGASPSPKKSGTHDQSILIVDGPNGEEAGAP